MVPPSLVGVMVLCGGFDRQEPDPASVWAKLWPRGAVACAWDQRLLSLIGASTKIARELSARRR